MALGSYLKAVKLPSDKMNLNCCRPGNSVIISPPMRTRDQGQWEYDRQSQWQGPVGVRTTDQSGEGVEEVVHGGLSQEIS